MPESKEHIEIKKIVHESLSRHFGVSLIEYSDEGDRLDVCAYTLDGIKIRVEIIWSQKMFYYDMANILSSDAKIKLIIANTKIIENENYMKFFKRKMMSEFNKGYKLLEPYNGNKILLKKSLKDTTILSDLESAINDYKLSVQNSITKNQTMFKAKIDKILSDIEENIIKGSLSNLQVRIDNLNMIFKQAINNWDVVSIRYGIKNMYNTIYRYEDGIHIPNLYNWFSDIFNRSYKERKYILFNIIEQFSHIMMESWLSEDVERGEKASNILLKLGLEYCEIDFEVTEKCYSVIDTWSADFFVPEIFFKQIILGTRMCNIYPKKTEDIVYDIRLNDELAWDDENFTYLIDAIKLAEFKQGNYNINIEAFKNLYLIPALNENIDKQIDIVDYFKDILYEEDDNDDFSIFLIKKIIDNYKEIRPQIAFDILAKIYASKNEEVIDRFYKVINKDKNLQRIYK